MEFLSSYSRLHIDVSCQDAGHDWESAVADDLAEHDFRLVEEGNIYEVEGLPEVIAQMDVFLNLREMDFYGADVLIDGRLDVRSTYIDGGKKTAEPVRYRNGHYMEVYRLEECVMIWHGADEYTREWITFARAYLRGNAPIEYPNLSPDATASEEEGLEELMKLFALPTLEFISD